MNKFITISALCSFAVLASSAIAAPIKVKPQPPVIVQPAVVLPSKADVTLESVAATTFIHLGALNPQGNKGDKAVTDAFGGDWTAIGAYKGADATTAHGQELSLLTFGFDPNTKKGDSFIGGDWTVKNTSAQNVTLDLVFAMHAGNNGGAWMFDSRAILAGETLDGTWIQRMLVGNNNAAGYSNVTFFARNVKFTDVPKDIPKDVPEPAPLSTLVLALGLMGYMARRRKQS